MRAGGYRHQVTILQPNPMQNTRGDPGNATTVFSTLRCKIVPLQGRELEAAQQIMGTINHRIESRWLPGVTPPMTVQYGSRYFDINAVLNINELSREMYLLCTERIGER